MTIIKFRIWSPKENRFVESGGTPSMLSLFFSQTATLHTVDLMPYQQFTGLIDENGQEVYEGDIIEVDDYTMEVRFVVGTGGVYRYSFVGVYQGNVGEVVTILPFEPCEVIGNIYQK